MALYEDGIIPFDDTFIEQFKIDGIQCFLKKEQYRLGNDRSFRTVEHWLYNNPVEELKDRVYNFLLGYYKQSPDNYEEIEVRCIVATDNLIQKLTKTWEDMCTANNW